MHPSRQAQTASSSTRSAATKKVPAVPNTVMLATKALPSTVAAFLDASSSSAAPRSQPLPSAANLAAPSSSILAEPSSRREELKNPATFNGKVTKIAPAKKARRPRVDRFREALAAMTPEDLRKHDEVLIMVPPQPLAVHPTLTFSVAFGLPIPPSTAARDDDPPPRCIPNDYTLATFVKEFNIAPALAAKLEKIEFQPTFALQTNPDTWNLLGFSEAEYKTLIYRHKVLHIIASAGRFKSEPGYTPSRTGLAVVNSDFLARLKLRPAILEKLRLIGFCFDDVVAMMELSEDAWDRAGLAWYERKEVERALNVVVWNAPLLWL
ncbi:hypothetical protein DFP72DRAFT_348084 [Ephemerocybe angulata]|uniref:Uncharacterized protein n=1 Tax=Ephemerocybe angulata TaxID=980116 RepID=A0A8H6HYA9_9AGAR|nr:hypothetical protein DFP72DRAFT_348084 [Tulosesus angulatus]